MTTAIALVSASASATAELQYSVDGSSWVKVSQAKMRRTTGLSVTIGEENEIETTVSGFIPANCFVRIATSTAGAGTASITYLSGQEVLVQSCPFGGFSLGKKIPAVAGQYGAMINIRIV